LLSSPDYLPDVTASRSELNAVIGAENCRRQSGEIASYARSYINTTTVDGASVPAGTTTIHAVHGWTPDISRMTIIVVGVVQSIGLGFIFVPLSVVTLSTLSPELRAEGAGLYSLSRNIGSSVGISVVNSLLTTNTQVNHADIAQHVTAVNRLFDSPTIARFWNPLTEAGRAALDAVVTQQAQVIAYIDDYKLLIIETIAVLPLLVVFKKRTASVAQPIRLWSTDDEVGTTRRCSGYAHA
jgi:hypothetical protein